MAVINSEREFAKIQKKLTAKSIIYFFAKKRFSRKKVIEDENMVLLCFI